MRTKQKKLVIAMSLALSLTQQSAQAQFASVLELANLNGQNGLTINGVATGDYSGVSVSAAGDVNGDGIDDFIIGASGASPNGNSGAGSSYVVFGSNSGLPNPFNLSTINALNGFTINGVIANDRSGGSVSAAGDINGDGIGDLIIGAVYADPNGNSGAGSSYVVFGSNSGLANPLNLSTLNGLNGFTINGVAAVDQSGGSVSAAGDVNGDGIDDLIIGARYADPGGNNYAGSSYVVFGSNSSWPSSLDLSTLNGSNGFTINGVAANDFSGFSVNAAGDVNGDGINDIIIGASGADPGGNSGAGSSYVVFGSNSSWPSSLDLSTLNGSNGFTINGAVTGDYSGFSVSAAGDVNGDGIDDLIIGARSADPGGNNSAGSSYVVFGSNTIGGLPNPLNLSTLNGSNGFTINGVAASDLSAGSVSAAGDINGDGIDDLIIGAFRADPGGISDVGSSYVVFGSSTIGGLPNPLNLSTLNGSNGFTINGISAFDFSGGSVSTAGDVNGDGIDDIIIGASGAAPGGTSAAGSSYVVFGRGDFLYKNGFE